MPVPLPWDLPGMEGEETSVGVGTPFSVFRTVLGTGGGTWELCLPSLSISV